MVSTALPGQMAFPESSQIEGHPATSTSLASADLEVKSVAVEAYQALALVASHLTIPSLTMVLARTVVSIRTLLSVKLEDRLDCNRSATNIAASAVVLEARSVLAAEEEEIHTINSTKRIVKERKVVSVRQAAA